MKTMQLNQVLPGSRFVLDGVTFVKLDEEDGVAFVLAEAAELKRVKFDSRKRKGRNNFSGSDIEFAILTWLDSHPDIGESVVWRPIDLTSMDGMRDYGAPLVRGLRSPYSDSDYAYGVNTDGTLDRDYVRNPSFAARPALYLKSDIFVSAE